MKILESFKIHAFIKIHESPEIHESLEMWYSGLLSSMPVVENKPWMEVSKACIGWHDHVGCYATKKHNKKLKIYEFLDIYESLKIRRSFEMTHESFELHKSSNIHESFESCECLRFMNLSNRDSDSLKHFKDSIRFVYLNEIYPTLVWSSDVLYGAHPRLRSDSDYC